MSQMTDASDIITSKWSLDELPNLSDKTALITGANTPDGVGWHIAHQLALHGAKVYLGARSLTKAQDAIITMLSTSPSIPKENLHPFVADLGDLKSVYEAATSFLATEARLDILVNNAGILPGALVLDPNTGINTSYIINHLSPFLLTNTLLPLLEKTAVNSDAKSDVRIVNVNSTSHLDVPSSPSPHFTSLSNDINATYESLPLPDSNSNDMTPNPLAAYHRYGYTKLANAISSAEVQRRFDAKNIPVLVTFPHPGGVATNGAAAFLGGRDNDVFRGAMSPEEGAVTPLFVAAHPRVREQEAEFKGQFIFPWGGVMEANPLVGDLELAKEVWESSEKFIGEVLGE